MAKLTAEFMADIDREVALVKEKMVEIRRDIHRHPERSKREQRTSNLVAEHLEILGLEVTRGQSIYSVVGLLRGDMGTSIRTGLTVRRELALRLPVTLELAMLATLMAVVIAIPFGVLSAIRRNSWADSTLKVTVAEPMFPAASIASTRTVCGPSASGSRLEPEVFATGFPSTVTVTAPSLAAYSSSGVLSLVATDFG